jgi:signal peptidase I
MLNQKTLKSECIQLWRLGTKQRTITSSGLSMHPFIIEGSTLTFVPSAADRPINLGDIALFERRDMLVVHRIVGHF